MQRVFNLLAAVITAIVLASGFAVSEDFDIAPFARRCCVADTHALQVAFDYVQARRASKDAEKAADGRYIYGLQWAEERDIKEVRVNFRKAGAPPEASVEYWFRNWPYPPPHMPTIEDPVDDPWQGKWLKASTKVNCQGGECRYTFLPLAATENPNAANLPDLDYRRTLKLRLIFSAAPGIEKVEVYSGSQQKSVELRIELGAGENAPYLWTGRISAYNGAIRNVALLKPAAGDSASETASTFKLIERPRVCEFI